MSQANFNHQDGNRSSVPSFKWRRKISAIALVLLIVGTGLLSGCTKSEDNADPAVSLEPSATAVASAPAATKAPSANSAPSAAATHQQPSTPYYQIFVRSFYDSNGDGIGDLNGVTEKLDYLKDLGIGGIWLMPIMKSPSYHGYDTSDYYAVNPDYGTIDDLKRLTEEAHKRGIKVIMDFIANHTSIESPWFVDAAKGKTSNYRNWYHWAEDEGVQPAGTSSASSGNPWFEINGSHYLGIFWEGMPDLNLDNPEVRTELIKAGQFWLKQGVDGFRLDAAKHIYEDFTSQKGKAEIFAKNAEWWQVFRKGIDEVNPDAYLVGEVWDSAAASGPLLNHALNGTLNFDLAKILLGSARSGTASDIAGKLDTIYTFFDKTSEGTFIDAPFLTNHDQNRVMNEVGMNVDRAKMAAGMLLTMPGNPFIYYGEEIGMKGAKPDEQIREPMLWNAGGKPGNGQTAWEPIRDNADDPVSVEEQLTDPNSILNRYKTLLKWRMEEPALKNGGIAKFDTDVKAVSGYLRTTPEISVLVLHNLSGKEQTVSLDGLNPMPAAIEYSTSDAAKLEAKTVTIPPYTTLVLK
ncbi:alpha-amylase family glycosyl hydrolase [Gorillibacterium timonense]|uniref:alpha-amylase family glycosyl hydrolase n=1 Tax=Gorillibacterium timonense TaxID=1689269 RepID=UPI0009ECC4EC|nr:alpha-amylase family glycosyl hydrolase [Gorillibacterium timonense]